MQVGKIYTFKLNSGEELIAKVVEILSDAKVIITEPVSIAPSQQGMQMIPSIFTGDPGANVTLNTNSITLYSDTEESIKDKYIEATTGIKLPDKKIILG
jgi:hypothetical protein